MAIIDVLYGKKDSDEAYYWNVASYCVEGNLQAVLDEYAFTLGGGSDLELLRQMKSGFVDTASIQIETWESFLGHREKSRLRTHFAVGYFNAQVNEKTMQRTENIRSAFNSPSVHLCWQQHLSGKKDWTSITTVEKSCTGICHQTQLIWSNGKAGSTVISAMRSVRTWQTANSELSHLKRAFGRRPWIVRQWP